MSRPASSRITAFAALAGCALALGLPVGLTAPAQAQTPAQSEPSETQRGIATVATGRNIYSAGGAVRLATPVEGDYFAAGGRVTIDQPVKGDAVAVAGSVDVRAAVGDDLRVAGGDVNVEGKVGGELLAAGGSVTLGPAAQIDQGASLNGGTVTIEGKVIGPLKVHAQRVLLNGEITGDARLVAERIELGPKARIGGTLSHASRELKQSEAAVVTGAISRDEPANDRRERSFEQRREWHWDSSRPSWAGMVLGYLGLLAAGVLWVLLFPKFSAAAPDEIRRSPWMSLAVGFGVLVGVPVLAVLLFISLLGIPLGIAAFALYPLLLLLGYLAGVMFVAERARQALPGTAAPSFRNTVGFVAAALLVVMLVSLLPVVGPLAVFLTTIAGIGACVLEWHRRRQGPPAAPA